MGYVEGLCCMPSLYIVPQICPYFLQNLILKLLHAYIFKSISLVYLGEHLHFASVSSYLFLLTYCMIDSFLFLSHDAHLVCRRKRCQLCRTIFYNIPEETKAVPVQAVKSHEGVGYCCTHP